MLVLCLCFLRSFGQEDDSLIPFHKISAVAVKAFLMSDSLVGRFFPSGVSYNHIFLKLVFICSGQEKYTLKARWVLTG